MFKGNSLKMDNKEYRDQAWKYFEMHAKQRMTLFSFYITISTALVAAIGVLLNKRDINVFLIISLGILMIVLSLVFWILDHRTRYFIHLAEKALRKIEKKYPKKSFKLVMTQERESKRMPRIFRYSFALRVVYVLIMLLGLVSIVYTIL